MALSDIVNISITTSSANVSRIGFGMPLILAPDAPVGFTERIRFYTSLAGVAVDFTSAQATYKAAAAMFAQNPHPPTIAVGRCALLPTQTWTITPTAVNSTVYAMTINGTSYSITSDGSATATEIVTALTSAIGSVSGLTFGGSATLTIARTVAGATASIKVADPTRLKLVQDQADPGFATDLAAIALEDSSSWYAIINPFNSKACADVIATYAEANQKLFICATQDTDVIQTSNTTDYNSGTPLTIAGSQKLAAHYRTAIIYHPDNTQFADAAWAGRCLPLDPGSETWVFKTLAGVDAVNLTATQRTNVLAKYANCYDSIGGVNITEGGKVSGNEFIDVIRFRDWLQAEMSEDIFNALANAKKVPFTDAGIAIIEGILRAKLAEGVAVGGLAASPAPRVTVPLASAVSSSDKAARSLTGVTFDAVLAGAIHATTVTGAITTS